MNDVTGRTSTVNGPPDGAAFSLHCRCGVRMRGLGAPADGVRCPRCRRSMVPLEASSLAGVNADPQVISAGQTAVRWRALLDVLSGRALWRGLRSWFTVPRMAVLCTLLLLCSTAWWTWSRYRYQSAVRALVESLPRGEQQLAAGDIDAAYPYLREAARAGEIIGPRTIEARRGVQLYREADIWRRLAPTQLDEFRLDEQPARQEEFAAAFDAAFANRTLIFDGRLRSRPAERAAPNNADAAARPALEYEFDWAWLDESGRHIQLELGACPQLDGLECSQGCRVILGAEIERLEAASPGGSQWRMCVKPESVTLLTAAGPLQFAGWPDPRSYEAVLGEQGKLLGVLE